MQDFFSSSGAILSFLMSSTMHTDVGKNQTPIILALPPSNSCSEIIVIKKKSNLGSWFTLRGSSKLCHMVDDWCKVCWTIKLNLTEAHLICTQDALNAYNIKYTHSQVWFNKPVVLC